MSPRRPERPGPAVEVGQVWESSDPRRIGTRCRVVVIYHGPDNVPPRAVLENLSTNRRTTVLLSRMRGRWHWRIVPSESVKA